MENNFGCRTGIDVHKESIEACVQRIEPSGHVRSEKRHWGVMMRDLLEGPMATAEGVTHVAMESRALRSRFSTPWRVVSQCYW